MNFLAHLYLSGDDAEVMVGNFIGDFVKGRDVSDQFGAGIAKGVVLHRLIDDFTDHHPTVKRSKDRLWPSYRHYAGVIVDVYYDHFLAARWKDYSSEPLELFAQRCYASAEERLEILPMRFRQMLPYMVKGNWLVNYAQVEGIHRALSGMSRRATFESRMDQSVSDLKRHYGEFESEFTEFMPQLKKFADDWLKPGG